MHKPCSPSVRSRMLPISSRAAVCVLHGHCDPAAFTACGTYRAAQITSALCRASSRLLERDELAVSICKNKCIYVGEAQPKAWADTHSTSRWLRSKRGLGTGPSAPSRGERGPQCLLLERTAPQLCGVGHTIRAYPCLLASPGAVTRRGWHALLRLTLPS